MQNFLITENWYPFTVSWFDSYINKAKKNMEKDCPNKRTAKIYKNTCEACPLHRMGDMSKCCQCFNNNTERRLGRNLNDYKKIIKTGIYQKDLERRIEELGFKFNLHELCEKGGYTMDEIGHEALPYLCGIFGIIGKGEYFIALRLLFEEEKFGLKKGKKVHKQDYYDLVAV